MNNEKPRNDTDLFYAGEGQDYESYAQLRRYEGSLDPTDLDEHQRRIVSRRFPMTPPRVLAAVFGSGKVTEESLSRWETEVETPEFQQHQWRRHENMFPPLSGMQ